MAKLKISQKQYNTILLREQESRLKANANILNESIDPSIGLLEEGWKEVVLGVALMLGVGLTGQNKALAQNAVKNETTMSQIKSTLENEGQLNKLVDDLKAKGMADPATKIADNAEHIVDEFNKIAADDDIKYRVDVQTVRTLQGLKNKLDQGYALKKATTTNDTIQGEVSVPTSIKDTIDVNFGSDNLFVTGGFTLSTAGHDIITSTIDSIKQQGGKILSAVIESSTDAEEIVKFITPSDPTGNVKLAELRTKSIADLVNSLGDSVSITHREIPNNGSNVVSTQQFKAVAGNHKATAELRTKTQQFRYDKITIVAIFETKEETHLSTPEIIKNYRFELVKVIESTGKTKNIKTQVHFKHTKFKCTKGKLKAKMVECSTF